MLKAVHILKPLIVVEQRAPHFHSALAPQIMGLVLPPAPYSAWTEAQLRVSGWIRLMESSYSF